MITKEMRDSIRALDLEAHALKRVKARVRRAVEISREISKIPLPIQEELGLNALLDAWADADPDWSGPQAAKLENALRHAQIMRIMMENE